MCFTDWSLLRKTSDPFWSTRPWSWFRKENGKSKAQLFTTEPLLLSSNSQTQSPPEHPCFAVLISQLPFLTFNQWESNEMSGEPCGSLESDPTSLNQAPRLVRDWPRIGVRWYFRNNVRSRLLLPSCLAKCIWQPKYHVHINTMMIRYNRQEMVMLQIKCTHFKSGVIHARSSTKC